MPLKQLLEAAARIDELADGEEVDPAELKTLAKAIRESKVVDAQESKSKEDDMSEADKQKEAEKKEAVKKDKDNDGSTDDEDQEDTEDKPMNEKDKKESSKESVKESSSMYESVFEAAKTSALKEARAQFGEKADMKLVAELATARAKNAIRESIDTAAKLLRESKVIPAAAHDKIMRDVVGLTESEIKDHIKAEERYMESLGVNKTKRHEGNGERSDSLPLRESEITKNTNALLDGLVEA